MIRRNFKMEPDEYRAKVAQQRAAAVERVAKEEELAAAARAALLASETPGQKVRREKRERDEAAKQERANDRWWNARARKDYRREERTDHGAKGAGYRTGKDIALRPGVKSGPETERIGR